MIDDYLANLLRVLGVGALLAALPFFASLADLQPPWPPAIGFVSAALVLLSSLLAWEWTRRARIRNRRALTLVSVALTVIGLFGYLTLYSFFVEPIPGSHVRVIRGFTCTAEARQVYGAACPDLDRDALQNAEWEATRLWTRNSVTLVRLGLTATWLLFTAGLIGAVGAIVAGRRFSGKPIKAPGKGEA